MSEQEEKNQEQQEEQREFDPNQAYSDNYVRLIGNLGKEPILKTTTGGRTLATMRFATNEKYSFKNSDGKEEERTRTTWVDVVAWEALAKEVAENFKKALWPEGKAPWLTVYGKLRNRTYQNKNGENRHILEVVAHRIEQRERAKKEPIDSDNQ